MRTSLPALLPILACLLLAVPASADVGGSFALEAGYADNPVGVADEASTAYGIGALRLEGTTRTGGSAWRLGFDATEVRFDAREELDFSLLAAGLEWFREAPREGLGLSAGLQFSQRAQSIYYAAYDYDELFGYLAFKHYPTPSLMLRGHLGLRGRDYGALPEESFVEPFAQLEAKRFWENRTTLGLTARLGSKRFTDAAARTVWDSADTPTASQFSLAATLARGLSDRVGLRFAARGATTLSDFPYYVAEDLYDSPLLDRYASEGYGATAAIKVLGPGQVWWELSGSIDGRDYGEILFADGETGSTREDTVTTYGLSLKRTLDGGAVLKASATQVDQQSDIAGYDWTGLYLSGGLTLAW